MINGVLVERTVKDVIPALQTNSEGLKKVLAELVKQYKRQEEEMEKWKVSVTFPPPFCPQSLAYFLCHVFEVFWFSNPLLIATRACRKRTMFKWCNNDLMQWTLHLQHVEAT